MVWQDNVRPLLELHTKLNENKAELESNRRKLQDAYLVQKKLHELYTKYKTAPIEEEREKARREYLDKRGVPESFRW